MPRLAIITPSYAPDFELCADLHRSIQAHCVGPVQQHIIVPRRDRARFGQLAGALVHDVTEFLPRSMRKLPAVNGWVNLRRPFPPLRGWITQQIVKLAAAARSDADVVLLVDSDIEFVRPFGVDRFIRDGTVRFYRKPREIDARLPRHLLWHQVARNLLGLPPAKPPFTDYVCWPAPWDPRIVRALLRRVESVTGRPWATAIGAQLHFSEEILYGVFVDEVLGAPANSYATDDMLCLGYSAEAALDEGGLAELLDQVSPDDIAVMISAKSGTPLPLRRAVLAAHFPAGERRAVD
ncbi:hypothetical protein Vqi01_22240 [Micromonospora qiuiae]|uniref:Uncharacterized protein n=1 Tax=Micromonospora qiuiae TaxID=502268 RepID=A0ABQ4JAG3_9ACTN|nr:DUF6492 family protein [Micromonospora qiuiae]GIJ27062.1 hypothetical protein Vqi01_22240 [Micromonospora qiuiae]